MEEKIYTKAEADLLVKQLQEVFSVVRILEADEVGGALKNSDGLCHCFDFWGKTKACVNCTSSQTLLDKMDRTKIEIADGEIYQVFVKYLNIEGEPCVLEILKDITNLNIDPCDLKEIGAKFLTEDSGIYKDLATGILNRQFFEKEKDNNYKNAAVVIVDMDGLKDINDIYGHDKGDFALKAIADVLSKNSRQGDYVIRYGGDEFVMVMPNMNKNILIKRLETIRKTVNQISLPEHENIKISISIGAVISDEEPLINAFKKADSLMYKAKRFKNRVVVEWTENEVIQNQEDDKHKILIVDDSDINRLMLKLIIQKDYDVLEAKDGLQAIELIDEYRQNISLILLDIEMPRMGGFDYLKYLKEHEYLLDIPVIVISATDDIETILKAYGFGAVDYITRPYNPMIVKQRVDNICKLYLKQRKFKEELALQIKKNK